MFKSNKKKKTKKRVERKQLLIYLIILNSIFLIIPLINAQVITSAGITTVVEGPGVFVYDEIQKIYEISDSSLEKGYSTTLNEKDAFRINIGERDYYILIWNITDRVSVIFPGERQLIFGIDDLILVDIDQDSKLDVQLELKAIEDFYENATTSSKRANLHIIEFIEEKLIPEGDYFELFDVTIRLAEERINAARELGAFIIFENFGEGPSEIDIVYSIIDKNEKEVFRGVDSKIVQTEDMVVKDFGFLRLPIGKYILRTEIFYGKNQTGEAEQDFEIVREPVIGMLKPLFFLLGVIFLSYGAIFARKFYKRGRKMRNPHNKRLKKKKRSI